MTGTQERAVAAMRAIGDTVTGAPPLRLPPKTAAASSPRTARSPGPDGTFRAGRAWRLWLVPAAAAAAVVVVAVSLVLVRSAPKESPLAPPSTNAAPSSSAAASGAVGPGGVPRYYVALPALGWYGHAPATGQANAGGLAVGETVTGKRLATVTPPHGLTFNLVSGAADDRTFVVGATSYVPNEKTVSLNWSETWYLLRISPGSARVATLTRLPVPADLYVTGAAISPDGTDLAVAYQQYFGPSWTSANGRPRLTVWSLGTGKVLRHWETLNGRITASTPAVGSRPGPFDTSGLATALRWTPDGRELAFAWNGTEIRLIELTSTASRQGDLAKASRLRAGIGTGYTPAGSSFTCDAAEGWSLSTGAVTFTCAGAYTPATPATGPGCGKAAPAHLAFIQQIALSGGASEGTTLAQSPGCTPIAPRTEGVSLGWASDDGSRVIGMLSNDPAAQYPTFGIFTKKTFTALPVLQITGTAVVAY